MARFYGAMQGDDRTTVTRMGHKRISGHIRGWNIGAQVTCAVDSDGEDMVTVYLTGGSTGAHESKFLGTWKIGRNGNYDKVS